MAEELNAEFLAGQIIELLEAIRDDFTPLAKREITIAGRLYAVPDGISGAQVDAFEEGFMERLAGVLANASNAFELIFAFKEPEEFFTFLRRTKLLNPLASIAITPDGTRNWTPALGKLTEEALDQHSGELSLADIRGVCCCFFVSERALLRKLADYLWMVQTSTNLAISKAARESATDGGNGSPKMQKLGKPKRSTAKPIALTSPDDTLPTNSGSALN